MKSYGFDGMGRNPLLSEVMLKIMHLKGGGYLQSRYFAYSGFSGPSRKGGNLWKREEWLDPLCLKTVPEAMENNGDGALSSLPPDHAWMGTMVNGVYKLQTA